MQTHDKVIMDVAAIGTTVGTMAEILPSLASIFTIVWLGIRIFETDTIQSLLGKEKQDEHGKTNRDPD